MTQSRGSCNPRSRADHDLLGAVPACVLGIPEDCIAGDHVDSVPAIGPQTAISDSVPTPDDGNGIKV